MKYFVYILYSRELDKFYVGHTQNSDDRLFRHVNSGSKSAKAANDWSLAYKECFETRASAVKRELEIKKKKSRKYILSLIQAG